MEVTESRSTRRTFLIRLGKTLAVGLGVALAPATAAQGGVFLNRCCRENCMSCPPGFKSYRCFDSCVSMSCCDCLPDSTAEPCVTVSCPCS